MQLRYTGQRVRLRPFASKDEVKQVHFGVYEQPNEYWGPVWFPVNKLLRDFDKTGLVGGATGQNTFAVERLDTGELVGLENCGLSGPGSISGYFGTAIAPPHRSQGFGREAKLLMLCFLFENFPVLRVGSNTVVNHWPARKGMEACGMHCEGYLRAAHCRDGKWYDVPWYVIFRHEWEKLEVREYVQRG